MEAWYLINLEDYKGSMEIMPYEVLEYSYEEDITSRMAKYKDITYGYNKSNIVCLNHYKIGESKIEFIWNNGIDGNIKMLSRIKQLLVSFGNIINAIESELQGTVDFDPSNSEFFDYKGAKELIERLILGLDSFIRGTSEKKDVEEVLTYTLDCIKRIKEKGDKWER
jgi:hypothetical protein